MTHEEIEAARGWIRNALLLSELPTIDKAWAALDALCEAAKARQLESLVGRRVRITVDDTKPDVGTISHIEDWPYVVDFGKCTIGRYGLDDFELLDEPTGEKGGDVE